MVLPGLVGGCGSGRVCRVPGGLLGALVFWAYCPHGAGNGPASRVRARRRCVLSARCRWRARPGRRRARAAATSGRALAAACPGRRRAPSALSARPCVGLSGGAPADGPRAPRGERHRQGPGAGPLPHGPGATWGACPRVRPSGGERALGRVDAVSRVRTRFRASERQLERRPPDQEHVHPHKSTFTCLKKRSPVPEHVHPHKSAFT